jgi:hypothetical protein
VEAVHAVPLAEPIAPAAVGNAVEAGEEADEGEAEPDVDVDVEDNGVRGTADDDFDNFDTDFLQELGAVRSGGQTHCAMTLSSLAPCLCNSTPILALSLPLSPSLSLSLPLSHTQTFFARNICIVAADTLSMLNTRSSDLVQESLSLHKYSVFRVHCTTTTAGV